MKNWMLCLSIIALFGCVSVPLEDPAVQQGFQKSSSANVLRLDKITRGMSYDDVRTIMGTSVVVGFDSLSEASSQQTQTIGNPFRMEMMSGKGKEFVVNYYFMYVLKSDGEISDDELMPVVFSDGKVSGKGWKYLTEIVAQYNLE